MPATFREVENLPDWLTSYEFGHGQSSCNPDDWTEEEERELQLGLRAIVYPRDCFVTYGRSAKDQAAYDRLATRRAGR